MSESSDEDVPRSWRPLRPGPLADESLSQSDDPPAGAGLPPTSRENSPLAGEDLPSTSRGNAPAAGEGLPAPPSSCAASSSTAPLMDLVLPTSAGWEIPCESLRVGPLDPISRPVTTTRSTTREPEVRGGDTRPPRRRRRKERANQQECPVCGIVPVHMRNHVEWQHLPPWLRLEVFCHVCGIVFDTPGEQHDHTTEEHGPRDEEALIVRWLLAARNLLHLLAEITDQPLSELHHWVTRQGLQAEPSVHFGAAYEAILRDLALLIGVPMAPIAEMSPNRPLGPVAILHWRTIVNILAFLPTPSRSRIRALPLPPNNDGLEVIIPNPPAVDAHCHLTTLAARGLPLFRDGPFRQCGVVDNRVFPHEWSRPKTGDFTVIASSGIHPSLAHQHYDWTAALQRMSEAPAIGECGLDVVRGPAAQEQQERLFRQHIRVALGREKPLMLHLRGGMAVFYRALAILSEEHTPTQAKIYVHCYTSDLQMYETWVHTYPRTIFGVSSLSIRTEMSQEFLRRADLSRIVLESDAPYLGDRAYDISDQAQHLADLRHISQRAVLGATAQTATMFFFC